MGHDSLNQSQTMQPSQRREPYGKCEHLPAGQWIAGNAVALPGVSIALACRTFEVSETCYRYSAKLSEENEQIADLLIRLTRAKEELGLRSVLPLPAQYPGASVESQTGLPVIRELELNLRIKPRKRLKRNKPDTLTVPDQPNMVWSMDFMADRLEDGRQCRYRVPDSQEFAGRVGEFECR